ncbi:hypothetical protein [Thermoplasma volcanium]|uniref:hypothetical protein n=1 Tax=Thermoplasma volcanium TaxID=50339 RepID=UPI0012E9B921|nr:hypothetical protein [Thermoplasma volcanium]
MSGKIVNDFYVGSSTEQDLLSFLLVHPTNEKAFRASIVENTRVCLKSLPQAD